MAPTSHGEPFLLRLYMMVVVITVKCLNTYKSILFMMLIYEREMNII